MSARTYIQTVPSTVARASRRPLHPHSAMVRIPGGEFLMGSDRHYPEEAPAHRVQVDDFAMDRYPVTNARFRRFVEETYTWPVVVEKYRDLFAEVAARNS